MPALADAILPEADDTKYSQSEDLISGGGVSGGLSERMEYGSNLSVSRNLFSSTPDLRVDSVATLRAASSVRENVQTLYGSLMRLNNEDFDVELLGGLKAKRRIKSHIPGLSAVTTKATALNARLSQMMNKGLPTQSTPGSQSKYATLPVVREDSANNIYAAIPYDDSFDDVGDDELEDSSAATTASANTTTELNQSNSEENQNVADTSLPASSPSQAQQQPRASVSSQVSMAEAKQVVITQQVPVSLLNSTILSKSSLVVSGGEGHINWTSPRSLDLSLDDLCLLLWQCRQY